MKMRIAIASLDNVHSPTQWPRNHPPPPAESRSDLGPTPAVIEAALLPSLGGIWHRGNGAGARPFWSREGLAYTTLARGKASGV